MTRQFNKLLSIFLSITMITCYLPAEETASSPQVVSGQAQFQQDGQNWTVTTSDQAVINWQNFSVPQGASMQFVQPSAQSVVVNNVVGNQASVIAGMLSANGKLFLINPNGIRVTSTGQIQAASFLASTLASINTQQILTGADMEFLGDSDAMVENDGQIEAVGGDIILIAQRVRNTGILTAPQGKVGIAAGNRVMLTQDGSLFVKPGEGVVPEGATGIDNQGLIDAISAELKVKDGNLYALAINTDGVVRATGLSSTKDGRIVLRAEGGKVRVGGQLAAKTVNEAGTEVGGTVEITGEQVIVPQGAQIDASGQLGGGDVRIGGDLRGGGDMPKADYVMMERDSTIHADAVLEGDGGSVVLWGEYGAWMYGLITARGGTAGGNGGFVEVSSKGGLGFGGAVDTTAALGTLGTFLLDPQDITVINGGGGADDGKLPAIPAGQDPALNYTLSELALEGIAGNTHVLLEANGKVTIQNLADDALTFQPGSGTVTFHANADGTGFGAFSMNSGDTIIADKRFLTIRGSRVSLGGIQAGQFLAESEAGFPIVLNGDIGIGNGGAVFNGDVQVVQNNLAVTSGAGIVFNGLLDNGVWGAARNVTLNATGNVDLAGKVGSLRPLNNLDVNAGGAINLAGGGGKFVTTEGYQRYNGPVLLGGYTELFSGGDVTFLGMVDSAPGTTRNLKVKAAGRNIAFEQEVGGTDPLGYLEVTGGAILLAGGPGKFITTNGYQRYNGPVLLGGYTELFSGGDVTFLGMVDSAPGTSRNMKVKAGGNTVAFEQEVGGTDPLGYLDVKGAAITFDHQAHVTTTKHQIYKGAVLGGGYVVLKSDVDKTGDGGVTFTDRVDSFAGSKNFNLRVFANGNDVDFQANAGSIDKLFGLRVHKADVLNLHDVTTWKYQRYEANTINVSSTWLAEIGDITVNSPLWLGDDAFVTSLGGKIVFNGTVDSTLPGAYSLTTNSAGPTEFLGKVGDGGELNNLDVTAGSILLAGGPGKFVRTDGYQRCNGPVLLGGYTELFSGGDVTFLGTVDSAPGTSRNMKVKAGGNTVAFDQKVGATDPLGYLEVTGGAILLAGGPGVFIETTGSQDYKGPVVLNGYTSLDGGPITFHDTIDSPTGRNLRVKAFGDDVSFLGKVGGTDPLGYLDVSAGSILLAGGPGKFITTNGYQRYNGPVLLGEYTELFSGGDVTFLGTVDSAPGTSRNMKVKAGGNTVAFDQKVGATDPLGYLEVKGAAITFDHQAHVTTTKHQIYKGAVLGGGYVVLKSDVDKTGDGGVTFTDRVDSFAGSKNFNLRVFANGNDVDFQGNAGSVDKLFGLRVHKADVLNLHDVTTWKYQTYEANTINLASTWTAGMDVLVNGNLVLLSSSTINGTDVTFTGSVNSDNTGPKGLTVNGSGVTLFQGPVGDANPLGWLTSAAGGTTEFQGGSVHTAWGQYYVDDVILANTTTLTNDNNSNVKFFNTVEGPGALVVNNAGATIFEGTVGGSSDLGWLTVAGGGVTEINGGLIRTRWGQFYVDDVLLGNDAVLTNLANSGINFWNTINGNYNLTVSAPTQVKFLGQVGNVNPLASLLVTGGGTTLLDITRNTPPTQSILVDGLLRLENPVMLAQYTELQGGQVDLVGSIDGHHKLQVKSYGGLINLFGSIGQADPLSVLSLNTGPSGLINIADGAAVRVTTTGSQTYNGPVALNYYTELKGGPIVFKSTVDSPAGRNLRIKAQGTDVTFEDNVGGTDPLGYLAVMNADTLNLHDVTTNNFQSYSANTINLASTLWAGGYINVGGNLVLLDDATFFGSDVTFGGTVTGPFGLEVLGDGSDGLFDFQQDVSVNTLAVDAGDGADTILFGGDVQAGSAVVKGGQGGDVIDASSVSSTPMTIYGQGGPDDITGTQLADDIYGGWGKDTLRWRPGLGNDMIYGEQPVTDPGDTLVITGAGGGLTMVLTGGPSFDGTASAGGETVTFTSIEGFDFGLGGAAVLSSFTYDGDLTLLDNGVGSDDISRLNVGGLFDLDFLTPAGVLELYGGPSNNSLTILGYDALYDAGLGYDGLGGTDAVVVNAPLGTLATPWQSVDFSAESIAMNGGAVWTTGAQSYQGPVLLGADASLVTDLGDVTFGGPVTSDGLGVRNLEVDAGGSIFAGLIGQGNLDTVLLTAFGDIPGTATVESNRLQLMSILGAVGSEADPLNTSVAELMAYGADGVWVTNTGKILTVYGGGTLLPGASFVLINDRTLQVTEGDIDGTGAVTVDAQGETSDLIVGGDHYIANSLGIPDTDQGQGNGPMDRFDIRLIAGRDVIMGNADGYGDAYAELGALAILAGRDFVMDNWSWLLALGDIQINAPRDVLIQDNVSVGDQRWISSETGAVLITAGRHFDARVSNGLIEGVDISVLVQDTAWVGIDMHAHGGEILVQTQDGPIHADAFLSTVNSPATGQLITQGTIYYGPNWQYALGPGNIYLLSGLPLPVNDLPIVDLPVDYDIADRTERLFSYLGELRTELLPAEDRQVDEQAPQGSPASWADVLGGMNGYFQTVLADREKTFFYTP